MGERKNRYDFHQMYNLDRGGEKFRKTYGKLSFRFSASESGAVALPPLCSRSSLSRLPSPAAIVASPGSSVDLRAQDQGKPLIRHEYTTPRPVSMPTIAPRVNEPHGHARGFSTSWRSVAFRKETIIERIMATRSWARAFPVGRKREK